MRLIYLNYKLVLYYLVWKLREVTHLFLNNLRKHQGNYVCLTLIIIRNDFVNVNILEHSP